MDRNTEFFLELFRKIRFMLLLVFIAASAISVYVLMPRVMRYKGQCSFYLAPEPLNNRLSISSSDDIHRTNNAKERVLQFVYSGELMDQMIKNFNLYDHYQIDTLKPYHREIAVNRLIARTEVYTISNEIIKLTVYDRNNEIAASMANNMVAILNQLNSRYTEQQINKEIAMYGSLVDKNERKSKEQIQKFQDALQQINDVIAQGKGSTEQKQGFEDMQQNIKDALNGITFIVQQEVSNLRTYNELLLNSRSDRSVIVIKKAVPELKSKKSVLVLYSLISGGVVTFLVLLISYLFAYHKQQLLIMFGK